jgi:hypothetical protein
MSLIGRSRLRAGDLVEVLSLPEIQATLDSTGALDGMPFMPEMVRFCGRRFRVAKRAHKTCDTVDKTGGVSVASAVHLEGLRCDGSGHGGCQAACLMFFKEAWLKPVRGAEAVAGPNRGASADASSLPVEWSCTVVRNGGTDTIRYRCQITEIPRFTKLLHWWDLRQYLEDFTSGNVGVAQLLRGLRWSLFRMYMAHGVGYGFFRDLFNRMQRLRGGASFPFVGGTLKKTPHTELGLQPGEWVRVKSFDAIVATLDPQNRNRGLSFDTGEMRLLCDKTFRVRDRIHRIVNEKTGEMMAFSNPCITLEGVYCTAETTQLRVFCPRAITPYWREIWLERAPAPTRVQERS